MGAPFLLAPALPLPATAEGLAAGVDASSSASSRFFSSALRAASAAFPAFFSAADLPLLFAASSHLAASAASALAEASAAFLSSLAAFLALPDSFLALPSIEEPVTFCQYRAGLATNGRQRNSPFGGMLDCDCLQTTWLSVKMDIVIYTFLLITNCTNSSKARLYC